jgi:hypothetical protein
VPSIGNFDIYKYCYIAERVIIFSILSEVYGQEIFEEKISLCFNFQGSVYRYISFTYNLLANFALLCRGKSRDSAVGIATGYGLDSRGVGFRVTVGSRIFSSPRRPGRLWGPPSFLSNGYRGLFPRG